MPPRQSVFITESVRGVYMDCRPPLVNGIPNGDTFSSSKLFCAAGLNASGSAPDIDENDDGPNKPPVEKRPEELNADSPPNDENDLGGMPTRADGAGSGTGVDDWGDIHERANSQR